MLSAAADALRTVTGKKSCFQRSGYGFGTGPSYLKTSAGLLWWLLRAGCRRRWGSRARCAPQQLLCLLWELCHSPTTLGCPRSTKPESLAGQSWDCCRNGVGYLFYPVTHEFLFQSQWFLGLIPLGSPEWQEEWGQDLGVPPVQEFSRCLHVPPELPELLPGKADMEQVRSNGIK